jgi:hypothetical protein
MTPEMMTIEALNAELAGAITNLASYHAAMEQYCQYYENSAFYPRKAGDKPSQNYLYDNYLQIFADKNIHYTSGFPTIKVDANPYIENDKQYASIREKILYATHRKSGSRLLQKDFARDVTKKSVCIAETYMNHAERCMEVRRYDPRYVFWKVSNGNNRNLTAFWAVFPISLQEAQEKYGVTPTRDTVSFGLMVNTDPYLSNMDGQRWFTMAIRWDAKHRVAWIGDKIIEEPHEHMMGVIPVDVCAPFPTEDRHKLGSFYMQRLIALQAELNDTIRRRSNIVKRMSNPIIWGRNIKAGTYEDVKSALRDAETGVLGLGKDGEVGILQLQELKTLYEHEAAIKSDMQRLSGFSAASFGESVGANTSGDALGMYFTPTQKHIEDQQISWQAFWESINAKILRGYDIFGRDGSTFVLEGYHPRSTVSTPGDIQGYDMSAGGAFRFEFGSDVISGNYINRVIMPNPIPKDELAEKRLVTEAVDKKFISRHTGHEMWGIESPEDEKQLLLQEQAEPLLNPQGTQQILQAANPRPAAPRSVTPAKV